MGESRSFFSKPAAKWLLAGAAVLAIGVGVSVAEWGPRWRGGGGHAMMAGPGGAGGLCARDPLRYEGVARAYLKADLDLKPEQNAEMEKLAATLLPVLKDLRDEICNNFAGRSAPVPVRLERLAVVLRKAADSADRAVPPTKSFYASLDERQKARLDELSERRRRHHGDTGMTGPGGRP